MLRGEGAETKWSPLPDSGHMSSTYDEPYKEAHRCGHFSMKSPYFALLDFPQDPIFEELLPLMWSADTRKDFWAVTMSEECDMRPYIILDLTALLMLRKRTRVFDSIIYAMLDWRSKKNHVVLCLNYMI